MTKAQIIAITAESARLVAEQKVGHTPISQRHAARIEELKQRRSPSRVVSGQGLSASYAMGASARSRD